MVEFVCPAATSIQYATICAVQHLMVLLYSVKKVSVARQFCALLSHVLTAYYLVTVVDNCFITRSHVFSSSIILYSALAANTVKPGVSDLWF